MKHEYAPPRRESDGVGVVDDPCFDRHRGPSHHPERPERLRAARAALRPWAGQFQPIQARPATPDELARVHQAAYIEALDRLAGEQGQLDADTYLAPDSVASAELAAGGGIALVEQMVGDGPRRGIALLRPPGHHARPDRAMGFCLLNNVAVAAAHARARGLQRIAVIDWDVHHGNGTQEMFYSNAQVLYVSVHQWPFYPGTGSVAEVGEHQGQGYTVNVPLSAGAGAGDYRAAFDRVISPIVEAYAPQLILVSAGFDAHRDDPLASMQLDSSSYGWMTAELCKIAEKTAEGRIGLFLEGGYNLTALETSLGSCAAILAGTPAQPFEPGPPDAQHETEIERARQALAPYWAVCR